MSPARVASKRPSESGEKWSSVAYLAASPTARLPGNQLNRNCWRHKIDE